MSKYSAHDVYIDAASGILRNRLGITNETKLEGTEASLVAARSYELARNPLPGKFDLDHLKSIHRYLFGDVYEWAGQIRSIDVSKGVTRFASANHIESAADTIFQKLAEENHLA